MGKTYASLFHWFLEVPTGQSVLTVKAEKKDPENPLDYTAIFEEGAMEGEEAANSAGQFLTLVARDRPILILDKRIPDPNLIPLDLADGFGYECPFPYLQPHEQPNFILAQEFPLADWLENPFLEVVLRLTDEVLDQHNVPEEKQGEWELALGSRLDNQVAQLLRILTGLIEHWQTVRQRRQNQIPLLDMADRLPDFSPTDACKPLIISLDERHNLQEKLRLIAPKLRQQLRRTEEMIPVGRLQEMSPYCLRDYVRRPGRTPAEKAGSKQELMGVKRFQDYNTPENRFLVYFAVKVLHLECRLYPEQGSHKTAVDQFSRLIERFKQQPEVQQIRAQHYQPTRPNYVLQQNPIYNSFYQAFLDWSQRKAEKERLWGFRHHLFGDVLYLTLVATIGHLEGAIPGALDQIVCEVSPDRGRYLTPEFNTTITEVYIPVYLQDWVYGFRLRRHSQTSQDQADIEVIWERHDLHQQNLGGPEYKTLKLWGFWYKPTANTLAAADRYLNSLQSESPDTRGCLIYLALAPSAIGDDSINKQSMEDFPWLHAFPDLSSFTEELAYPAIDQDPVHENYTAVFLAKALQYEFRTVENSFTQQVQQFWLARLQEWISDG